MKRFILSIALLVTILAGGKLITHLLYSGKSESVPATDNGTDDTVPADTTGVTPNDTLLITEI